MYNVKIKQGINSEEIIYYAGIINDDSDKDRRKVVPTTGEICPANRTVFWNPFDDDYVIGYQMHDDDSAIKRSMRRTKQVVYDIAKANDWEYFMTFTFNPAKVDRYSFDECSIKFSNWLKNMRKKCPRLKYIVVPELHKDGAWHFHGLFMNVDGLDFVDGGKRYKGRVVYNVGKYRFGWTEAIATDGRPNVCTYLTKYYTKKLIESTPSKKRYWASRNCDRPLELKYFVEFGEEGIEDSFTAEFYKKESKTPYQRVTYYSTSIYTTNTTRFNTNEDEEIFPPHISICESSEDNK